MKNALAVILACFLVGLIAPKSSAETLLKEAYISVDEVQASGYNPEVDAKVAEIVRACRNAGVTGEYDIALWLHDWLIYNANYDYSFTYYGPEGVLLYGRGVCASYTTAYQLLLDSFDIENEIVESPVMNHAWNLVKIDGQWCHVDCTWDDPSGGDGENHQYFGLNDALMKRDHQWNYANYRATTSLQNNYSKKNHQGGATQEEINECLNAQVEQGRTVLDIVYLGDDPAFDISEAYQCWECTYNWKYGLFVNGAQFGGYHATLMISITEPWEKPREYTYPVKCPDFTLRSLYGEYRLSSYRNNGLVLVFAWKSEMNIHHLADRLTAELDELHSQGVEVILNGIDVKTQEEMEEFQEMYPDFVCTYDGYRECTQLRNAMDGRSYNTPQVFVIDRNGMIVNYAAGFNPKLEETIRKMHEVATGAPIPGPTKQEIQNTANSNLLDYADANGTVTKQLVQQAKQSNGTLFLMLSTYDMETVLPNWEKNYPILQKLGLKLVVCTDEDYSGFPERYPNVTFLADDGYVMWDLASTSGQDFYNGVYYNTSALVDSRGYLVKYVNGKLLSGMDAAAHFAYTAPMRAVFPADLETIESEAFRGAALTTLDLSKSAVRSIAAGAFSDCPNLTFVRLPDDLTIAEDAFTNCGSLILLCDYGTPGYRYAVEHGIDVIPRY